MTTLPQPGDYAATGLPLDQGIFAAWMFLHLNAAAQPAGYRNATTLALAQTLVQEGEQDPSLLAAALLAVMPIELCGRISRQVSPACAAIVADFHRQTITRFAYIDFADPATQKLAMVMMCATMESLEDNGTQMLARLDTLKHSGNQESDITLPMLPDARGFRLIYDKISAATARSTAQLEDRYLKATLGYDAFRTSYLQQLLHLDILSARARDSVRRHMQEQPAPPAFEETGLPDTHEVRTLYAHLATDPRVTTQTLTKALDVARILSDSGDCTPATASAALLSNALEHLTTQDLPFLRAIAGDEALEILEDNAQAGAHGTPIALAGIAVRQIAVAQAIANLRTGADLAERMFRQISTHADAMPPLDRQRRAAQVTRHVGSALQEIIDMLQPQARSMEAPALAAQLDAQINHTVAALNSLGRFLTQPDGTQPARPRDPHKGGPSI